MECLRSFLRVDGETSLKGRVERSLDSPDANAARPTPWTLQTFLASALALAVCRGPPSADDDDVPPRASASGPRKPGMRRPPSASPLPDIPESDEGDAATADAVEVMLSDDSPSRRTPAGAAGGAPARKLSHRRSWSWSMQWSAGEPSAKARRKHESGERGTRAPAEADEADEAEEAEEADEADESDRADNCASARAAAEEGTGTSTAGSLAPSHSRSGSWSDWASVSAASWFSTMSPEAREEARRARALRKEQGKRDLANAEALRARAAEENDQLDRVMQESKLMHEHSLPLTTRSRDAAAACVFVTPPPKKYAAGGAKSGRDGEDADDFVDEAASPDLGPRTRSASRADAGEWVEVELRGMPSRWAKENDAASVAKNETETEEEPGRTIRASAFFATLDQRGARGEGSCTLYCVALAEWLAANPGRLPTECLPAAFLRASDASEASDTEDGASDAEAAEAAESTSDLMSSGAPGATTKTFRRSSSPPRFALDFIVTGAAREWRRLCADAALVARFPDKHFDLDTAAALHVPFSVEAEARASAAESDRSATSEAGDDATRETPLTPTGTKQKTGGETRGLLRAKIHHGASFVGFLRPPGVAKGDSPALDALAEAAPPLETIVAALAASAPSTYAVSWNDHFFLLHFRREAGETVAYVMDSLGERLCEGCRRAYVLRFDGESLGGKADTGETADAAAAAAAFVGDVLPSRALRDVGAQILAAASGARNAAEPDPETLMRRLQIEFHRVEAERA